MYYKRLVKGLNAKGSLISYEDNYYSHIKDTSQDWYLSLFEYNQEQYQLFQSTGSVAGIKEVTTETLIWDFDAEDNVEQAQKDCLELITRLKKFGLNNDQMVVAFSGNKGFHTTVYIDKRITIPQFKAITFHFAKDLSSFDDTINIPTQLIRISGTKHPKSGLYKIDLLVDQLSCGLDAIKKEAITPGNIILPIPIILDIDQFKPRTPPVEVKSIKISPLNIDFIRKVKGWSNCKWAILNGYQMVDHERNEKLLCVIATAKSLHYPKDIAYYHAKAAYERGVENYGATKKEDWKTSIWAQVEHVYSSHWNGGSYSCKDGHTPWLSDLCSSLKLNACQAHTSDVVTSTEVFSLFRTYAENFDDNVLATGIGDLDKECNFLVGTSVGILAPPGVGKTSLCLKMLHHNSQQGIHSIFFSYDMFHATVYLRLIQKHFGLTQEHIFNYFKTSPNIVEKWKDLIAKEYQNVKFCFKSGQTCDDLYETICDIKNSGVNLKLVMVDYNELLNSGVSDPTQSSALVAQRLRQISNDTETCVVTLLQPAKVVANPAEEIRTYQGAKGSGAIAQSLSMMLSLSRPGFNPRKQENDRFITINCLKNRQGPLFTIDQGWNGLTGEICGLSLDDQEMLKQIRMENAAEKAKQKNNPGGF